MSKPHDSRSPTAQAEPWPLEFFACPNPDCAAFNIFGAGNLSVAESMGKDKSIRRLYCNVCQGRFSERQGSLLEYSKLPPQAVVRIVKCLGHGCSVEATADICEVDARTVQRLFERAGPRAEDFHRLQLDKLQHPLEAVQMDELHGRVFGGQRKKRGPDVVGSAHCETSSDGSDLDSYGVGGQESIPDRHAGRSTDPGSGGGIAHVDRRLLPGAGVALAADRRSPAVSGGHSSGLRGDSASPTPARTRPQTPAASEAAAGLVGGRGQEGTGCRR